jgi:hypothetical protein
MPETASRAAAVPSGVVDPARAGRESERDDMRKMTPLAKGKTHSKKGRAKQAGSDAEKKSECTETPVLDDQDLPWLSRAVLHDVDATDVQLCSFVSFGYGRCGAQS